MPFTKGHPNYLTIESKARMKANSARYWLGKHRDEETKRKIGINQKGTKKWPNGRIFSEETKKKMSKSAKGKIAWNKGLPNPTATAYPKSYFQKIGLMSAKKQSRNKSFTSIEVKLYEELKRRGLLFEKQKIINNRFMVDVYIPSLNLVIEADGDYWHSLPKAIKHDKLRNFYFKENGFSLLRLTESEINNGEFKNKLQKVTN